MRYPKAYYQMQKMAEICRKNRHKAADPTYTDALIAELEQACDDIEVATLAEEDAFTGDVEDFDGMETAGLDSPEDVEVA